MNYQMVMLSVISDHDPYLTTLLNHTVNLSSPLSIL